MIKRDEEYLRRKDLAYMESRNIETKNIEPKDSWLIMDTESLVDKLDRQIEQENDHKHSQD